MAKPNAGTSPRPGAEGSKDNKRWFALAGGLAVAILIVVVVFVATVGEDRSDSTSTTVGPDDPLMEVSTETCEDIAIHVPMAMWNPVLADELNAKGCPWPQVTGFTDMDGGTEDQTIAVPYEAEEYQQIFDLIAAERFGICAVGTFDASETPGFVYGFRVDLRPMTCAEANPNVTIEIGEFATRVPRDQAANHMGPGTLVLGRWVMNVTGEDAIAADILTEGVRGLGAYEMP